MSMLAAMVIPPLRRLLDSFFDSFFDRLRRSDGITVIVADLKSMTDV
jgi:hypothetical protein